ncbi:MAG: oxaloacetate decarboxylase [Clostridia bacterium]|nr:oxaloacetate decarboxylase [Clostridia bacterium]
MSINVAAFISSLRFMVEGWLGIFIVMGIIIACIYGLNRVAEKIEEKAEQKNS